MHAIGRTRYKRYRKVLDLSKTLIDTLQMLAAMWRCAKLMRQLLSPQTNVSVQQGPSGACIPFNTL